MHDTSLQEVSDSESEPDACEAEQYLCDLKRRMDFTTLSTAFSGCDAPGTAFAQIHVALSKQLNIDPSADSWRSRHLHAVEWERHCQEELVRHPHSPRCLFSNIEDSLDPTVRCRLDQVKGRNLEHEFVPKLCHATGSLIKTPGTPDTVRR